MYFRRHKNQTAFGSTDLENLLSALRNRNQNESFSKATMIVDRALNGPASTSIRFSKILFWPLDSLMKKRYGRLVEELQKAYDEAVEDQDSLKQSRDLESLGISWAVVLELVFMIIQILMELRDKKPVMVEGDKIPGREDIPHDKKPTDDSSEDDTDAK